MSKQQPKIELKKARELKSLSEETPAYTAQLWVDGKHFANVSNSGHGGPDMVEPVSGPRNDEKFWDAWKALDALVAETFPVIDVSDMYGKPAGSETMTQSLELLCHTLLGEAEMAATLKRALARQILFVKSSGGGLYTIAKKKGPEAQIVAALKSRDAGTRILNEMPFAEALQIYSTAT